MALVKAWRKLYLSCGHDVIKFTFQQVTVDCPVCGKHAWVNASVFDTEVRELPYREVVN